MYSDEKFGNAKKQTRVQWVRGKNSFHVLWGPLCCFILYSWNLTLMPGLKSAFISVPNWSFQLDMIRNEAECWKIPAFAMRREWQKLRYWKLFNNWAWLEILWVLTMPELGCTFWMLSNWKHLTDKDNDCTIDIIELLGSHTSGAIYRWMHPLRTLSLFRNGGKNSRTAKCGNLG